MTPIAPHVTAFFRDRLPRQRGASPRTCDSYSYAFRLLLEYASPRLKVTPSDIQLEQVDATLVLGFLDHLERTRGNSPRTRNARLAAIKSFFRFVEHRVPSVLEQSRRILAIPTKRINTTLIRSLSAEEIHAVLDAPDPHTWSGIRDRAMIHLCFAAGLRVSELISLPCTNLKLHPNPSVRILGKGRKERCLPLWKQTADDLRAWLAIRGELPGMDEVFVNARRRPMSRYGFRYLLTKHAQKAAARYPSIRPAKVSPHVLRHTCAMTVLRATGDLRKVALWLGHEDMQTTQVYLRADPNEKLAAIEAVVPPTLRSGVFSPPDRLIAMLQGR